jgi:phenylacetate-CoA ligase
MILSRKRLIGLSARAKKSGAIDRALRYNPLPRRHVLKTISRFEAADLAERRCLTDSLTTEIIAAAHKTNYGRAFGPCLGDWPILGKTRIRDAPEDFITSGWFRLPAATGGTTGLPIRLMRSATSIAAEQAFLDWLCRERGLTWGRARIASLRGDAVKDTADWTPPFGINTQGGSRLILSSPHLCYETLPWYVDAILEFRPDILWLWPTMAANLVHLLQKTGRNIKVPLVLTTSERLDPHLRDQIEHGLEARVIDYYGQAERSCFASSMDCNVFYFHPAYGKVELLLKDNDDVGLEQGLARIVSTGFWNPGMPLVRYDTGDCAVVPDGASGEELEAIALGVAPFFGVAGRDSEFVFSPDGNKICGLNQLPREVEHLSQLQVLQERLDMVVIRAVVGEGFGADDRRQMEINARAKIPASMRVKIDLVESLEKLPNGKTPFVIRRLPDRAV